MGTILNVFIKTRIGKKACISLWIGSFWMKEKMEEFQKLSVFITSMDRRVRMLVVKSKWVWLIE